MTTPTAPPEVWVLLDRHDEPRATVTSEPSPDATEIWQRYAPRHAPYRVVRYVHEDAVAAAVDAEREACAKLFDGFTYGPYSHPAQIIRFRNRAKGQSNG